MQTTCLGNQLWDWQANEVVLMNRDTSVIYRIATARYAVKDNKTLMQLIGAPECVEIAL
ncbi:hypothetical protein D3C85_1716300 [compost metagenome]